MAGEGLALDVMLVMTLDVEALKVTTCTVARQPAGNMSQLPLVLLHRRLRRCIIGSHLVVGFRLTWGRSKSRAVRIFTDQTIRQLRSLAVGQLNTWILV